MTKQELQKIFHEAEKKVSSPESAQKTITAVFANLDVETMSKQEMLGRMLVLSQLHLQKFMFEVLSKVLCDDLEASSPASLGD